MAVTIEFTDNAEEIIERISTAKQRALFDIGAACQGYAKEGTPVRTGTLRDSWMVEVHDDEDYVLIGSPVDAFPNNKPYASYVELGTSKMVGRHMLQNAATQHAAEYKSLAERALKNG